MSLESLTASQRLEQLEQERDEAREWVRKMHAERQVLTCVYCGHSYPPGTPASGSDALTAHIKVCEKHPLRAAEARIAALEAANKRLVEAVDGLANVLLERFNDINRLTHNGKHAVPSLKLWLDSTRAALADAEAAVKGAGDGGH